MVEIRLLASERNGSGRRCIGETEIKEKDDADVNFGKGKQSDGKIHPRKECLAEFLFVVTGKRKEKRRKEKWQKLISGHKKK